MAVEITNMSEYLSEVSELRATWKVPEDKELWFRAEDKKYHDTSLMPGTYRQRLGKKVKSAGHFLEVENYLYEEFRRCGTQLSPADAMSIDDDWDSYFLMQHHGAPTRILDWTEGALIALHSAVRHKPLPAMTDSTLFVLDPHWLNGLLKAHADRRDAKARWKRYLKKDHVYLDPDEWDRLYLPEDDDDAKDRLLKTPLIPLLWDLHHSTRRIAAQRSRLMIFGTDPRWLQKMAEKKSSRLVAMTVPKTSVREIRRELRDAGITESVVFPDLDGLGRELQQEWEMRS
jgi:hypothetical protein